mgnify:CR=1 FL=1
MDHRIKVILFILVAVLIIILFFTFNLNFPFIFFLPLLCCLPSSSRRVESEVESTEQTEETEIPEGPEYRKKEPSTELDYLICPVCGNKIKELNLRFCPLCVANLR